MPLRNLWLPVQLVLAENLRRNRELLAPLQKSGADNDLVAQDGLVVVDVRGAVGTVVAIYGVSCEER